MKTRLTSFLLCFAGWSGYAQSGSPPELDALGLYFESAGAYAEILERQFSSSQVPTSVTTQRLVMTVVHDGSGLSVDSVRYYYATTGRGASHHPGNPWSYGDYFSPFSLTNSVVNSYPSLRQYIFCDSVAYYNPATSAPTSTGTQRPHKVYTYDGFSSLPVSLKYYWYPNSTPLGRRLANIATMGYDGSGLRTSTQLTDSAGGLKLTQQSQFFSGNGYGQRITDVVVRTGPSIGSPAPESGTITYSHTPSGLPQERILMTGGDTLRTTAFYDGTNRLQATLTEVYHSESTTPDCVPGGHYHPYILDSFAYTGPELVYTSHRSYARSTTNTGWNLIDRADYHVNANGHWDTATRFYQDAATGTFIPNKVTVIAYNAQKNRNSLRIFSDNDGDGQPDALEREYLYYYEPWAPADIAQQSLLSGAYFTLAPNPAPDAVRISWTKSHEAPARYTLSDINSRLLTSSAIDPSASEIAVTLKSYPPGIFIFRIFDTEGRMIHADRLVH